MDIVITEWALDSYIQLLGSGQFTRQQYWSILRPDVEKLRGWKAGVVSKLTKGLAGLAKQRKVEVVQGRGEFASANMIKVETAQGAKIVAFDHCIIAAGSSVARIPGLPYDDKRIFDTSHLPGTQLRIALPETNLRGA